MATIAELAEDRTVEGVFAVTKKERRRTRAGAPYLALELADASGRIEARVWSDVELLDSRFAEGDAVRVLGVFQDEPVEERGDGRTGPDAIVAGDDVLLLRAERSGRGNGRVYHVRVAVGDGACAREEEITVCVPHDVRRRAGTCVDDGAVHESTVR